MLRIRRRFSHYVYGVIQSCLTCALAAAIASASLGTTGAFAAHWLKSWWLPWLMMLPVVPFAAPAIRKLA